MNKLTISDSLTDLVGRTPMIRLSRFGAGLKDNLFGKCEFMNPGGSVKDRIAFHMVRIAEESGQLKPGDTIVEATAGNTGIGLALVAALRGYKMITVMSAKVSSDKVKFLQALNCETIVTPSGKSIDDPDHFMNRAREIAKTQGAWLADQFYNESNVQAHYETTGPEIWEQTAGAVDVLVVGVGTGGTLTGAGRYLKERKKSLRIVLADPVGSMLADLVHGKEGGRSSSYVVEGIGQDFIPGNFDKSLVDDVVQVTDAQSIDAAKRMFATEGLFVGSSSGCIAYAAEETSRKTSNAQARSKLSNGLNIVAILPDGGRGYLSTIYDADWLKEKGLA